MKTSLTYILVCFSFLLFSQTPQKEVNNQFQVWYSLNSTMRFTDHWGVMADYHHRMNNGVKDPSFYFARLGAVYWVNSQFTVAGGYAHLWLATQTENGWDFANQNRIYQQLLWRFVQGKIRYLFRIRNEQRWQESLNYDGSTNKVSFSNRVRFLFSVNIPIFENQYLPSISLADEVLIAFGEDLVYNTFDQNRIFLGIKQRISKNISFDFGYMNVYQQKSSGYQYDSNHTLRLFFYYSPDFRKHKDPNDIIHFPIDGDE